MDRSRLQRAAMLLLATCMFAGCGGRASRQGPEGEPGIVDLSSPSAPVPPEQFLKPEPALIAPGDRITVRVLGYPDYSGDFWVAADGRVNLLLLGTVQAAGKSADQLDRELSSAYGAYLRNLDLSVNVSERGRRQVYVLGEVTRPGNYDFMPGDRVLHALAAGGGMSNAARENNVVLMRRTPDGKDHAYRLDFGKMHDTLAPQDVYLQPGDVVFVPKSRFSTVTQFALSLLDVLGRGTSTALVAEDLLGIRDRAIAIAR